MPPSFFLTITIGDDHSLVLGPYYVGVEHALQFLLDFVLDMHWHRARALTNRRSARLSLDVAL